ncbi:MAG: M20/M25/M40 family metallo-hydrolase [Desulfobulbaceae bacterium]|nr:M20/M25/M40 family metallo-hydrolase [Desulfobulbaceae bacterium]
MALNAERLTHHFTTLCEIDSPSRGEGKLAVYLSDLFSDFRPDAVIEDNSSSVTGSDCGNVLVRFNGTRSDLPPVFFNCHLDVIGPCLGVKVRMVDGFFYSSGSTVLGADDKAGIAILIEVLSSILEDKSDYGPVEFLFTTCEEIGLLGAKAFDPSLLCAHYGYCLDSTGVDNVIVGAPAAYYLFVEVHGLASHAGLRPRHGISAIQLASQVISRLKLGQIDEDTTANIGLISGGTATNIIPDFVEIKGEVRSHSLRKLLRNIDLVRSTFQHVVDDWHDPLACVSVRPHLKFSAPEQYPLMLLPKGAPVLSRVEHASLKLGRSLDYIKAGGGSDANIFNSVGLPSAILGIGMEHVHSTAECISLADMLRTAELVQSILTP